MPLTALIANNNIIGAPRWGLVAPAEIARIDVMYGPFSAAYAGNSMGAVLEITTRLPEKFEASISQAAAFQNHSLYGTKDTYGAYQTAVTAGDRVGKFAYWVSANYQDSESQPLSYVTSGTFPAGTTGGYAAVNKLNQPANILGSSGLLHTQMANFKVKAAYDLTPYLRAAYTFGLWRNDASSRVETYLRNAAGDPDLRRPVWLRHGHLPAGAAAHVAQPQPAHRHPRQVGLRGGGHALCLRQGSAAFTDDGVADQRPRLGSWHERPHCRPRWHRLDYPRPQGRLALRRSERCAYRQLWRAR